MERLRRKIGADLFHAVLAEWPAQNAGRNRGRNTYVDWVSQRTGQDLRSWFTTWLESPTTPAA
jgi:aminopeptidase N